MGLCLIRDKNLGEAIGTAVSDHRTSAGHGDRNINRNVLHIQINRRTGGDETTTVGARW
jgi:hypothetical protein